MRVSFVDNILLAQADAGYSVDLQPHLGLIALIAVLRERGHDAVLVDPKLALAGGEIALGPGFYGAIAERIVADAPDIVGFTSLGCNVVCTIQIARQVRQMLPGAPIILGGPHASILDREILGAYPQFDAIARGEADLTIGPFVEALGGRHALADVPGITYRSDGNPVRTRDAGPVLDLDALPFPAYDLYPIRELGLRELRIDAGRGCPFGCTFCSTAGFFGRRYRLKSAARLVDELRALEEAYGIRHFALSHDLFTVSKEKVLAFCRFVAPYGYAWTCSARLDCVDDELLRAMRDAGCDGIYYGIESGSPQMQRRVAKNLDLSLYHPRLTATLALGMGAVASFITGYPHESREDQDQTLELIGESVERYDERLALQLHLLTPEPGTALLAAFNTSLAYDAHLTDFTFPPLESDDAQLIGSDSSVFVCHRYYDAGLPRENNVEVAEGWRALSALGHPVIRALRRENESFASLVRAFGRVFRAHNLDAHDALIAFVTVRFGREHPLVDAVRMLVAHAKLRRENQEPMAYVEPEAHFRLARCVEAVCGRDGEEILRRAHRGVPLDEPPIPVSYRLLVASHDLKGRRSFDIDRTTFAIARVLRCPTTIDELGSRFDRTELEPRLSALCALGAVVRARDDELEPTAAITVSGRDYRGAFRPSRMRIASSGIEVAHGGT